MQNPTFRPGNTEKPKGVLPERLIGALSRWVFQDDLSALVREDFVSPRLRDLSLSLFPSRETEEDFLYLQSTALKQRFAGQQIETLFAENGIVFCPIKGMDLSRRVWPRRVLRGQSDLDVVVLPRDRAKARKILRQNGWTEYYRRECGHHDPVLVRQDVAVEIHFKFPHFGGASADELLPYWIPEEKFRYRLPLEMNLAMLFCHGRGHHWMDIPRLLLDCGFLVRAEGAPDWKKMNELTRRFNVPSPALLFAAFPDFFPAEMLPDAAFPPEAVEAFRRLFEISVPEGGKEYALRILTGRGRFSAGWFWERLKGMRPSVIRKHIHEPRGAYGKLLAGYFQIFFRKLGLLRHYGEWKKSSPLCARLRDEETVEKSLRHG